MATSTQDLRNDLRNAILSPGHVDLPLAGTRQSDPWQRIEPQFRVPLSPQWSLKQNKKYQDLFVRGHVKRWVMSEEEWNGFFVVLLSKYSPVKVISKWVWEATLVFFTYPLWWETFSDFCLKQQGSEIDIVYYYISRPIGSQCSLIFLPICVVTVEANWLRAVRLFWGQN